MRRSVAPLPAESRERKILWTTFMHFLLPCRTHTHPIQCIEPWPLSCHWHLKRQPKFYELRRPSPLVTHQRRLKVMISLSNGRYLESARSEPLINLIDVHEHSPSSWSCCTYLSSCTLTPPQSPISIWSYLLDHLFEMRETFTGNFCAGLEMMFGSQQGWP